MIVYTTKDDDVLDAICAQHYGHQANGVLEQVLTTNRHLAKYDAVFPAGINICLPEIQNATSTKKIKLWQ